MLIHPAETRTVVLDDAWQLDVTVVTADYVPIAGAEVEVITGDASSVWPRRHQSQLATDLRHELGVAADESQGVQRWTAAVTGELGIASLVLPREDTGFFDRFVLRVDADGYVPRAMDIRATRPGRDEWVVQLERGGTLIVGLADPEVRIVGGFLVMRQGAPAFEATYPDTWEQKHGAAIGEPIVGLATGTYTLWHVEAGRFSSKPLATVALVAGTPSTVRLDRADVEEWIAQRLDMTLVWMDGDPSHLESVNWQLRPVDWTKTSYRGHLADLSIVRTPDVRPGHYRLVVDGMQAQTQVQYVSREVLDTSMPQHVVHMDFGSLDWIVVDRKGRPWADVDVHVRKVLPGGRSGLSTIARTDARGRAKDFYAFTGPIEVSLADGGTRVVLDESEYRGRGRVVTIPALR